MSLTFPASDWIWIRERRREWREGEGDGRDEGEGDGMEGGRGGEGDGRIKKVGGLLKIHTKKSLKSLACHESEIQVTVARLSL